MGGHARHRQAGFTIIELMIATAVFSAVLLLCGMAIVHVGRMYYKGSVTSKTQDTARKFGEDVSQAIQFGTGNTAPGQFIRTNGPVTQTGGGQTLTNNVMARCIGDIRYSYVIGRPQGTNAASARHAVWRDRLLTTSQPCDPVNLTLADPGGTAGQEMLANKMRLARFEVTNLAGLYEIDAVVSYGDADDLFGPAALPEFPDFSICKGVNAGGQFCASAAYKTTVGKRL
ncbi:MAG: prepilin-type N-terminal cleavage/methylation domain-containing protein [Candidatus Saccharimonadales bacterium]